MLTEPHGSIKRRLDIALSSAGPRGSAGHHGNAAEQQLPGDKQLTDEELARRLHEQLNGVTRRRGSLGSHSRNRVDCAPDQVWLAKEAGAAATAAVAKNGRLVLGSAEPAADTPRSGHECKERQVPAAQPLRKRSLISRELQLLVTDMVQTQLRPGSRHARGKERYEEEEEEDGDNDDDDEDAEEGETKRGGLIIAAKQFGRDQQHQRQQQQVPKHDASSSHSEQEQLHDRASLQLADGRGNADALAAAAAGGKETATKQVPAQHLQPRLSESGGGAGGDSGATSFDGGGKASSNGCQHEPCARSVRRHTGHLDVQEQLQQLSLPRSPASPPLQSEQQQRGPARQPRAARPEQAAPAGAAHTVGNPVGAHGKIPKLPMVMFDHKWYRAKVLKDGGARVLLEFSGYIHGVGPFWLPKDSERVWRGSYKGRDWKHLGEGAWEPRPKKGAARSKGSKGVRQRRDGGTRASRHGGAATDDDEDESDEDAEHHGDESQSEWADRGAHAPRAPTCPSGGCLEQATAAAVGAAQHQQQHEACAAQEELQPLPLESAERSPEACKREDDPPAPQEAGSGLRQHEAAAPSQPGGGDSKRARAVDECTPHGRTPDSAAEVKGDVSHLPGRFDAGARPARQGAHARGGPAPLHEGAAGADGARQPLQRARSRHAAPARKRQRQRLVKAGDSDPDASAGEAAWAVDGADSGDEQPRRAAARAPRAARNASKGVAAAVAAAAAADDAVMADNPEVVKQGCDAAAGAAQPHARHTQRPEPLDVGGSAAPRRNSASSGQALKTSSSSDALPTSPHSCKAASPRISRRKGRPQRSRLDSEELAHDEPLRSAGSGTQPKAPPSAAAAAASAAKHEADAPHLGWKGGWKGAHKKRLGTTLNAFERADGRSCAKGHGAATGTAPPLGRPARCWGFGGSSSWEDASATADECELDEAVRVLSSLSGGVQPGTAADASDSADALGAAGAGERRACDGVDDGGALLEAYGVGGSEARSRGMNWCKPVRPPRPPSASAQPVATPTRRHSGSSGELQAEQPAGPPPRHAAAPQGEVCWPHMSAHLASPIPSAASLPPQCRPASSGSGAAGGFALGRSRTLAALLDAVGEMQPCPSFPEIRWPMGSTLLRAMPGSRDSAYDFPRLPRMASSQQAALLAALPSLADVKRMVLVHAEQGGGCGGGSAGAAAPLFL